MTSPSTEAKTAVMYWDGGERAITPREKATIEEHGPSCYTVPLVPAQAVDPTDPWRGLYLPARMPSPSEYGDLTHPDTPLWPDDREDALDKLVHAQGFDFHIVAGDFTEEAMEDGDELYWQELRAWNPEAPEGEWRLAWKGDTEDGPYAWFVRPMALRPEPVALAATGQQVGEVHPDDVAVDAFAAAMKLKMADARAKGRGGWEDPAQCSADDLSRLLRGHVEKGDPRDVANFCMMLWSRQEGIAAQVGEVQGALLAELLSDSGRAAELANRLIAPGPKAAQVSASETHEISDFVFSVVDLLPCLAARDPVAQAPALTFAAFRTANVSRCEKWHPEGISSWSPSDWLTAAMGELGELASEVKMHNRVRDGLAGNKEQVTTDERTRRMANEAADVVTYLDLFCAERGIDLGAALVRKFNEVSERVGFPDRLHAAPAQAIDLGQFRDRIKAAIDRIVNHQCLMRIPVDNTDPDVVLADILRLIEGQRDTAPGVGNA